MPECFGLFVDLRDWLNMIRFLLAMLFGVVLLFWFPVWVCLVMFVFGGVVILRAVVFCVFAVVKFSVVCLGWAVLLCLGCDSCGGCLFMRLGWVVCAG